MPDSLITKKALASSLKELMETQPLTKISVGDICEKCGMNRKSFYYHFCDKYELVNEIRNRPGHIADFEEICEYFYSDREFYRNALRMTGQNSFRDYFRTQIHPVIRELIGNLLDSEDDTEFLATFIADGTVSALIRWLNESDPEPPAEMARRVRHTMAAISRAFTVKNGDGKAAEKEAI